MAVAVFLAQLAQQVSQVQTDAPARLAVTENQADLAIVDRRVTLELRDFRAFVVKPVRLDKRAWPAEQVFQEIVVAQARPVDRALPELLATLAHQEPLVELVHPAPQGAPDLLALQVIEATQDNQALLVSLAATVNVDPKANADPQALRALRAPEVSLASQASPVFLVELENLATLVHPELPDAQVKPGHLVFPARQVLEASKDKPAFLASLVRKEIAVIEVALAQPVSPAELGLEARKVMVALQALLGRLVLKALEDFEDKLVLWALRVPEVKLAHKVAQARPARLDKSAGKVFPAELDPTGPRESLAKLVRRETWECPASLVASALQETLVFQACPERKVIAETLVVMAKLALQVKLAPRDRQVFGVFPAPSDRAE